MTVRVKDPFKAPVANTQTVMLAVTSDVTAGAFVPPLANALQATGMNVHVVSAPGVGLDRLSQCHAIMTHPVRMAREPSLVADLFGLAEFIRLMRSVRPSIVLAATPKASLLAIIAARIVGVPLVVHLMWGLRSETLHGARRALLRTLETVTARLANHVLANSHSLSTELQRLHIVSPHAVSVLGQGSSHGVDTGHFVPAACSATPESEKVRRELALLGHAPVIGYVGRLATDKGVLVLLEAAKLLRVRGREFRLLLVGPVENQHVLEQIRSFTDIHPSLVVPRNVDALPYYQNMDVHCLPSFREGFPNVVLEAAACRVPTVTTTATGAVDSVRHGVTGLAVPVANAHALADGLGELLVHRELREAMGRTAQSWVEEHFREEVVIGRTIAFLKVLQSGILPRSRHRKPMAWKRLRGQ